MAPRSAQEVDIRCVIHRRVYLKQGHHCNWEMRQAFLDLRCFVLRFKCHVRGVDPPRRFLVQTTACETANIVISVRLFFGCRRDRSGRPSTSYVLLGVAMGGISNSAPISFSWLYLVLHKFALIRHMICWSFPLH
ncbi:hypothetical protein SCLCIDRAFT_909925 [Scleroderma citrinum Foug A]|uniref:Uncharacterized protein n=1 Tax=Scleroderma citrinum Foug A TaxID=1036808 RepID=A0A0C2ZHV9_9AGAM|nr:hypothetical protein SCLCIDRAFT_909925 [Scleroderma citrinum Foug A]